MSRGTKAIIDLNQLKTNYKHLKDSSAANLVLVVKADAYGHGLQQVVKSLGDVDCYAVATLKEAQQIREVFAHVRILLLEGFMNPDEMRWAIKNNIDCVIHQQQQLDWFLASKASEKINIWLKMDSGMNRLGFHPDDYDRIVQNLLQHKDQYKELILMSHFANADDANDPFSQVQIDTFFQVAHRYELATSFNNSSSFLNEFPIRNDWNRIGLALYGVSPIADKTAEEFGLAPVMTVVSNVIEIKAICKGEGVGYGQVFKADKDMKLAIIGMGYGDGYPWRKESKTSVLIDGQRVPLVGKVSMDMMAVDVTDLKGIEIGQQALIWGKNPQGHLPVEEIAKQIDAIPYVLLCGLTSRVEFIYEN